MRVLEEIGNFCCRGDRSALGEGYEGEARTEQKANNN